MEGKRKKITSKQVKGIRAVLVILFGAAMLIFALLCVFGDNDKLTVFVFFIVMIIILLFIISDMCETNLSYTEWQKEIENRIVKSLPLEEFKEVSFIYKEENTIIEMMSQILKHEGCRFYAKLTSENKIILVVKDKSNEEVYKSEIENLRYFDANFKF